MDEQDEQEQDAYVSKTGATFTVFQGNTGRPLSVHTSREKAEEQLEFLHRKNKPEGTNRGASARERETKRKEDQIDRAIQEGIRKANTRPIKR